MKRAAVVLLLAVLSACSHCPAPEKTELPAVSVTKTALPVKIDGIPDEEAWKHAEKVDLVRFDFCQGKPEAMRERIAKDYFEKSSMRLLYDDKYLYAAFEMEDRDIIGYGKQDYTLLYREGDAMELFLHSEETGQVWEIYGTPNGKKCAIRYISIGARTGESFRYRMPGFLLKTHCDGTLNQHYDTDRGWTLEMAVPLKALEHHGVRFSPEHKWTVFPSRYNYGRTLRIEQLSCYPPKPCGDNHIIEYYAPLRFRTVQTEAP